MSIAQGKIHNASYFEARGGHEPVAAWRGPERNRTLAWARFDRDDLDLLACRHVAQGERTGAYQCERRSADALQAARPITHLIAKIAHSQGAEKFALTPFSFG